MIVARYKIKLLSFNHLMKRSNFYDDENISYNSYKSHTRLFVPTKHTSMFVFLKYEHMSRIKNIFSTCSHGV